ncbi:MAG: molybdopterin-dependent oxidoreductase [Candidatus Dormibacteraceae bacterium]
MAISQMIGAKIQRREDPRLITGHGRYTDDFTRAGTTHMAVVRSPYPHARITSIEVAAAKAAPGVVAVLVAADFQKVLAGFMPVAPAFVAEKKQTPDRFPIAGEEVCFQGEPVAVVIAETKYQAADGAGLVEVEYESLPVATDLEKALNGGPTAHTGAADNIGWDLTYIPWDASEEAFNSAEVKVSQRIHQQRLAPTPMETRAVAAEFDAQDNTMTIWMSSQNPHFIRLFVGGALGLGESRLRVISRDVGGGFGAKISPYPEDYLVPAAAKLTGRPVKWSESRTESLQTTTHGRGQYFDVDLGLNRDGTLRALRVTQVLDMGAYCSLFTAFQACACLLSGGAYRWPALSARTIGVLTNKVPTDPYRGAGRPEATHLCERIMDIAAAAIGMDPVELRRKNFITEFPATSNFGLVIDSGAYDKSLTKALDIAGYEALRREQKEKLAQGKYMGIGVSTWIELCGFGPSAATAPAAGVALVESSQVRVFPSGGVSVYVGTHSHGQGHDTTFAQIVADTLGVPMDSIQLHHGDTGEGPAFGYGTYGSRSLAVGGMAVRMSCLKVVDKARKLAAHLFEADEADVVYENGNFTVKGSPDKTKAFGEVAFASYGAGLPEGMEHGLEAVSYFDPPNFVWPFGAHICVVEVDPDTGGVDMKKYVAVDDCGNVINPMIVEGQLHGGIAQGIAQALFEEMVYDEETGQLRTGTFIDYAMPTANEMPPLFLDSTVTPSPTNELGVKGIGEAGTIASSVAVINAICDALRPLGINHIDMPASPDRLWKQIHEARQTGNGHHQEPPPHGEFHKAVLPHHSGQEPMPGTLTDEGADPHGGLADPERLHEHETEEKA